MALLCYCLFLYRQEGNIYEKNSKKPLYLPVSLIAVTVIAALIVNLFIMTKVNSSQTEKLGRMRIELIAADLQNRLGVCTDSLNKIGNRLSDLMETDYTEEDLRAFLSEEKKKEIASTGRTCLNIFCATPDGRVFISDMETPEDYVLQDRDWYKALMSAPRDEEYISSVYEDAWTDGMCFTVAASFDDGKFLLGMDYNMNDIQSYISKMSGEDYGDAMIVNSDGTIAGYTDESVVGEKISDHFADYRDAFLLVSSNSGSAVTESDDGGIIFGSCTENDWYLLLKISRHELYKDAYVQFILNSVIIIALMAVIAVFYIMGYRERCRAEDALEYKNKFISRMSDKFRKPLNKISEYADSIKNSGAVAESVDMIRLEAANLGEMMNNILYYSDIVSTRDENNEEPKNKRKHRDLSDKGQRFFRMLIIIMLVVTMLTTIFLCSHLYIRSASSKMLEEAGEYSYQINNWVTEQESIMNMFVNSISANPSMLDDYEGMVKYLDEITRHYKGISATYIANPEFEHGHPMVMNNGWVPAEDYVEEERQWYIDALASDDYNITEPYYDARTGEYCITFSKAVYTGNGKQFLGVFAVDFYLDVLTNIISSNQAQDGYAFLVDKDGQVIDHPNPDYRVYNDNFVNIRDLPYYDVYTNSKNIIKPIRDYDGRLRMCLVLNDELSDFSIVVLKDTWKMYGGIIPYAALYLVLFSICIIAVNTLIKRMMKRQIKANRDLKKAASAAAAADKAKSSFLARMSHEIRTPINAILGMNEMILRENNSEAIEEYALSISSAGNTLLALINEILDFSRIEDGKIEIIPVKYETASMISDLVNIISDRAAEKGLDLELDIDPEVPAYMYGDDIRIKQIITNLLTNAVKYTEKGAIRFTVKQTGIIEETDDVILYIDVSDTGIGIHKEDISKLFDSFQRIDEQKNRNIEGTGLGIPITHNLLLMMDSHLDVKSVYGQGSSFSFALHQKRIGQEKIGQFDMHHRAGTKRNAPERYIYAPDARILVVDDNKMNLKVAAGLLKRNGIVPDTALSGKECIELVKKNKYHIIFMDHMMPDMDGVETYEQLRSGGLIGNETAVIAMTANAVTGARDTYLSYGFEGYLSKPIVADKLEDELKKHLPKDLVSYRFTEIRKNTDSVQKTEESNAEKTDVPTPAASPDFPDNCSFLNIERGMSYCGGDKELYGDMVQTFRSEAKLKEIEKFYEEKDLQNYRILVHAVKSTALSIGAVNLSEQAKALENAAKTDDKKYIEENHRHFMESYKDITEKIGAALNGEKVDGNAETETVEDKTPQILVVDDDPMNRKVAQKLLSKKYLVDTAASGKEAMDKLLPDGNHTDLILLDIHMPDEDGFEVIKKLKADQKLKNIPVIFLTADDDQNAETEGFKAGAMDFIRKPFIPDIMLQRIDRILELHRLQTNLAKEVKRQTKYVRERQERMERLSRETVLSLAKAVEAKDKYTNGHSERVAYYARLIAEKAGMSEADQNDIYFIGLLHDIGKIGVPDTVINKTSKLTDEEFAMIKEHPIIGAKILKDITEMPGIEKGARWHHERYDGKGYPDGIKGEEIPEFSRIICVADAYYAMTSTRSYRDVLPQEKVRAEIVKERGTQFDPKYADIMIELIDRDKDYKMRE